MIRSRAQLSMVMATVIFAAFVPTLLHSEENTPENSSAASADKQAIRKSADDFVAAFNRRDAKALASHWTEDGEYINENGQRFQGRASIAEEYDKFFAAHPEVKLKLTIDSVRMISPTTAVEDGRASLEPLPAGAPGTSRYTAIHLKQDGQWRLASVRDSRVEVGSTYGHLADLAWLIGDWTTEHAGTQADVEVRWAAQKSYIQLIYSVTRDGQPVSSSTEMIGWDPIDGRIKSWSFTSQGGRAIGVWTPHDTGWLIASEGVSGDGKRTLAINIWTRLAGDALGWTSVRRSVDDVAIDDAREVVLKRKKESPKN